MRDRLPFLLDPTAAPLPRIRLSHGLIASLAFFVLQGITVLIMLKIDHEICPAELTIAYGIAGSVRHPTNCG